METKRTLTLIFIFLCWATPLVLLTAKVAQIEKVVEEMKRDTSLNEKTTTDISDTIAVNDKPVISDWEILKLAIVEVESENNDNAHNKDGDCLGCLQLTPIYVAECNRLSGYEKYTLNDRLSREKSMEMFELFNKHHNPEKDIKKAVRLHNPKGGKPYQNKVLRKMEEMRDCF